MEPFSCQQHYSFLVDSAYDPDTSIELPLISQEVGELTHASSGFPYYHSGATREISATEVKTYESSSSPPAYESHMDYPSSQVGEEVPTSQVSMDKKRKNSNGTSLSSGQSKDTRESKNRKQRKSSGGLKATEEKKQKANELKATKACEEPPSGYIHVRARRGQATDSHSLAERVRREKISERMKMLQGLVPGCDKVTGKALVLDEIINYVQSLQNQVEFLSMKLASLDPILYDIGEDYDDRMIQRQTIPSVIQAAAFENATNSYPLDSSASFLLHGQGPRTLAQDNESFQVQGGDHRQVFLNQAEFSNMCSFQ